MIKNRLQYRLYGFVPYNLSDIQKGIQYGHACIEYSQKYFKNKDYQEWVKLDKTFILLNGGITDNLRLPAQGLQHIKQQLSKYNIKNATFYEPDLNSSLTAIVFLVDERVYDKLKYPEGLKEKEYGGPKNIFLRHFLSNYRLA